MLESLRLRTVRRARTLWPHARKRMSLWARAIRESYIMLLPLTVIGAVMVAAGQPTFAAYQHYMAALLGDEWQLRLGLVFNATMGVTGLLGAMAIADRLTALLAEEVKRERKIPFTIGAIAGTGFLMVVLSLHSPSFAALGYISIFQSIVVGVAVAELMHFFLGRLPHRTQLINVSHGLSLHRALQITFAAILSLGVVCVVSYGVSRALQAWTFTLPGALLAQMGHDFLLNPLVVVLNQVMWLVGVNGGQFLLHASESHPDLFSPATALYAPAAASLMFVNAFGHLGGAGATWGLIVCCLWRGKDQDLRNLSLLSILPAVFNINELLLLGIPFIWSRTLAIPFILAPLSSTCIAMLAVHTGFLHLDGQAVVWSTPALVSGYLMGNGWSGVVVQLLCIAVSVAIYAPFLRQLEQSRKNARKAVFNQAVAHIMDSTELLQTRNLEETSFVGEVARCLHDDFRHDLQRNRVELFYQPQHDVQGRITGVEALLRWTHPTHGPVPAQAIVTLAEESGLIHQLGQWVAQRACQDIARWRAMGIGGFKVSINMSPMQLEQPQCVAAIRQAMSAHQVTVQELGIELTEGKMLSSSEQAEAMLQEMQEMGMCLSMDDFGMGCTSLLYLHRFRIHEIKFDGVLTRQVERESVSQDIIRCVSGLAASQKSLVVAEFVESASQQNLLRELGCTHFQGWLYSKALPFEEFCDYFNNPPPRPATQPLAPPAPPPALPVSSVPLPIPLPTA